jgi:hypothetical protein
MASFLDLRWSLTRRSFPFEDPVVVLKVKGKAILDALENSVSKFPALEGTPPKCLRNDI